MHTLDASLRLLSWSLLLGAALPRAASRGQSPSRDDGVFAALAMAGSAALLGDAGPLRPLLPVALAATVTVLVARLRGGARRSLTRALELGLARALDEAARAAPLAGAPTPAQELTRPLRLVAAWAATSLRAALASRRSGAVVTVSAAALGLVVGLGRGDRALDDLGADGLGRFVQAALGGEHAAAAAVAPALVAAAWVGGALARRLHPRMEPRVGAAALALPCVVGMLHGVVGARGVVAAAACLWTVALAPRRASLAARCLWPLVVGLVEPGAGALSLALCAGASLAGTARARRLEGNVWAALVACGAVVALGLWSRAGDVHVRFGAPAAWLALAAAALAARLVAGASRARRGVVASVAIVAAACGAAMLAASSLRGGPAATVALGAGALAAAAGATGLREAGVGLERGRAGAAFRA